MVFSAAALLSQACIVLSRIAWVALTWSAVITGFGLRGVADQQPDWRTGKAGRRPCKGVSFVRRNIPGFSFFSIMFCTDSRSWEKIGSISEQPVICTPSRDASWQLGLILSDCSRGDRAERSDPPKDTLQAPLMIKSQKSSGCARAATRFPVAVLYSQCY